MIYFLLALAILVFAAEKRAIGRDFARIELDYRPSSKVVEIGESFNIITLARNRSARLIPFLRLTCALPCEFNIELPPGSVRRDSNGENRITGSAWLRPRQSLERRVPVSLPARGRYFLRSLTVSCGDFLGLSDEVESFDRFNEVVVLPREAAAPSLDKVLGGFLGDVSVRRFIFEDPVLTLGYREYSGREPMRNISWKQSARTGALMVKKFDYTLEPTVSVLLNIDTAAEDKEALIELCYSLARTVCRILEENGVKYDFLTNATTAGALSEWSHLGEGLGDSHFSCILEGLGRATYSSNFTYDELVRRALGSGAGRGRIVITPTLGDSAASLSKLREFSGGCLFMLGAREAEVC